MVGEIHCYDDSESFGEYFSLDNSVWKQIDWKVADEKRIRIGRPFYKKDVRVFIQKNKKATIKTLNEFTMLPRGDYRELRKQRGEEKGLPLEVGSNGTIVVTDKFIQFNFT
jgi:hypothetical protein